MSFPYQSVSYDSDDEVTDFVNGGLYPSRQEAAEELAAYQSLRISDAASSSYMKPRRFRSIRDCRKLFSCRCCFATSFLFFFGLLSALALYFFMYDPIVAPMKIYDYVVVGSGPAGSIVARRLAEAGNQVLLLEAGGPSQASLGGKDRLDGHLTRFDIPGFWSTISEFPEYHWGGFNIPGVIAGRALGGSGVENAMLYVRCTELDMRRWNISGDWTWTQMLETYLAIEDYCLPNKNTYDPSTSPPYHSVFPADAPEAETAERMVTAQPTEVDPVARSFVAAANAFGISSSKDFNAPGQREGVGYFNFNIRGGVRDSVAGRFLGPMLQGRFPLSHTGVSPSTHETYQQWASPASSGYANFDVAIDATVRKVLLSGGSGTACQRAHSTRGPNPAAAAMTAEVDEDYDKYLGRVEGASVLTWVKNIFGPKRHTDTPLPRAYGVTFSQAGEEKTVYLTTPKVSIDKNGVTSSVLGPAVVLSAGTLGSPKILMSSGIGPVGTLQQAGVCARVGSPQVGRNIRDHPTVGMIMAIGPTLSAEYPSAYDLIAKFEDYSNKATRSPNNKCPAHFSSSSNGTMSGFGMLGSPGISSGAFLTSPFAKARSEQLGLGGETQPDIQLTVFPTVSEPHMVMLERYHKRSHTNSYSNSKNMLVTVSLLDPIARYDLQLNASAPELEAPMFVLPDGETSYLHALDVKRLEWGVKQVRGILASPPLSSLVGEELSPGSHVVSDVLRSWISANAFPNSHWVGSVRMGKSSGAGPAAVHAWKEDILDSAVDERLRVRGVTGLYVADASVIPIAPNGNVHSTVAAVAYRAADFILGDMGQLSYGRQ